MLLNSKSQTLIIRSLNDSMFVTSRLGERSSGFACQFSATKVHPNREPI